MGRWAALALAAALAGCAGGAPGPAASSAPAPAVREDAGPRWLEAHEVDHPARPLAPIEPDYPESLRALGVEGDVEARVVVHADGSPGGAELVTSSHDAFTAAAREALREARFQPARLAGRPVASWLTVRLRFRLED